MKEERSTVFYSVKKIKNIKNFNAGFRSKIVISFMPNVYALFDDFPSFFPMKPSPNLVTQTIAHLKYSKFS